MKKLLITIIITLICTISQAQTTFHGYVKNKTGKPVQAMVTLSPKGTTVIASFADADKNGKYSITYNGQADSIQLNVSSMEHGSASRMVKNLSQEVNFTLKGKAFELKEVVVKADKIRESGDTLNYNVAAYKDPTDRVIGDVLKKMPGIEVDNGKIKFNGQDIKNFYIENMDLLQQRYGIATNNISAEDVATVQVYQNHQPIRALQGIRLTDDVSLNIKLKKNAKGTVAMTGMMGLGRNEGKQGDKLQLAGELTTMYFGRNYQNMTLYKGNNAGINVEKEFQSLGDLRWQYSTPPLSLLGTSRPNIASNRYLQNRSHIFSTNQALKIDSISNLEVNIVYQEDRQLQNNEQVSDYYLSSDKRLRISETTNAKKHIHHLEGSVNYKYNGAKTYLVNQMNVDANWNNQEASCLMNSNNGNSWQTTHQRINTPKVSIDDELNYTHRRGKSSYSVQMWLGFDQKPYQLTCDSLSQDYTARSLIARIKTGMGWKWGAFGLNYTLMGNMNLRKVESELDGMKTTPSTETVSFENDYNFNTYSLDLEQKMSLELRHWYFDFSMPLILERQQLKDNKIATNESWDKLYVRPNLEVKYIFNNRFWLTLTNSFYSIVDNSERAGRGLVMRNYRSFQRNEIEEARRQRTQNNQFRVDYHSAYHQLFLNATASRLHSHNNAVTGVEYENNQTIYRVIPMPHDYDSYRFVGELSKGFDFWRSTFKLSGSYSLSKTQQLIQQNPTRVKSKYWSTSAHAFIAPVSWLYLGASYAFGQGLSYVEKTEGGQRVNNSTTSLNLSVTPLKNWILSYSVEDNYNNLTMTDRHCWFSDAKMIWKTRTIDYELAVGNIFNRQSYTRVNYSGLDIFSYTSQLRARHIMGTVRFKIL